MTLFAIPKRPSSQSRPEPDFSKTDCGWEIDRILHSKIEKDLIWSVLFLSVLSEEYRPSTPAVHLRFFRVARGSFFYPVDLADSVIYTTLRSFERVGLISIKIDCDRYMITPLIETWEHLEPSI